MPHSSCRYSAQQQAMFHNLAPLVLASGSPRRRELLAGLGLTFRVHPAVTPEPTYLTGTDPAQFALTAARAKAWEVAALHPEAVVLAADTIVALDGDVLGKPVDQAMALTMLERLAGREHAVITGCTLRFPREQHQEFAVTTRVWMRRFGPDVLAAYVATEEPMDKAGAYGIQERAALLVERIEGSYTNVVGLPLAEVMERLLHCSAIAPLCPH